MSSPGRPKGEYRSAQHEGNPMTRFRLTLVAAAAALLAACATTAPAPPPPPTPAAHFKEDTRWQHAAGEYGAAVPDRWWTLFGDPVLDDLEARLVLGNENLKAALAQVAQARAALQASRAALSPTLSVGAGAARAGAPATLGGRSTANAFDLSADASWELDLWGRLRLGVSAAGARLQASADDLAAARLSARATLAQSYFALRSAEAQAALLARTQASDERVLQLTQDRKAAGVAGESDVLQARTQLATVQAQRREAELQRAQLEHAIAVLLGLQPAELSLARSGVLPEPPAVPEMLPSTLLERRPDIAAAQRRVAAAYRDIGVADAAYFPSIDLTAGLGYKAAALGGLVSAPQLAWSLGAALARVVFDGGARQAASDQARAAADQATAAYRQAVLTAFQEVEDNLAAADALRQEEDLQRQALDAAQRNVAITDARYRAGTVSFLDVASAQTAALSAESAAQVVRNRRLAAGVTLLKNLAGRWS